MADQPTATQIPQQTQQAAQPRGWTTGKIIAAIILILVLGLLVSYGVSWATSDRGRQIITNFKYAITTKYNPFYWYGEQLKKGREIGSVWETETNKTAEEVGVAFEEFKAIGSTIMPAGSTMAFKYSLNVGEGVKDLKINPKCNLISKDKDGREVYDTLKSNPFIIPSEPEISTDDPLSYSNIICQAETEELNKDRTILAKGTIRFTQSRQRNSLRVYFTKDITNIGDKFFEAYGIEEDLPIKSTYNNEPVELGLGVSDENIQPVIIGKKYFPSIGISLLNRWDGRAKIKEINLYLPKEIKIDKNKSPPSTLCPFKNPTSSGANYIKYESEKAYLDKLEEFGKGVEETLTTYQRFFCWLTIDESILGGADYVQDQYSIDVSYDYEFQPKSETIILKGIKKGDEEETEEASEESEIKKYYLCYNLRTEEYLCVTECTEDCDPDCNLFEYPSKEACEEDML